MRERNGGTEQYDGGGIAHHHAARDRTGRVSNKVDVVYAADVGKPNNLGWARRAGDALTVGHGAFDLATALTEDASRSPALAIGFECPLFLLVSDDPVRMLKSREGEGRRPWSAGAAPSATTSGVVAMAWVLRRFAEVLERLGSPLESSLDREAPWPP